ncbi:MAG: hypothetical protein EPO32_13810 [Anaerolineae bacterium]|nr:MAG: hypothetical protein EPO32_13810 [Anaerolineae bacterium]
MPRIKCFYEDCIHLENGLCGAALIELDPDDGCLTFSDDPADLEAVAEVEEVEEEVEDSWDDEGFEELEDLDLEDEDY